MQSYRLFLLLALLLAGAGSSATELPDGTGIRIVPLDAPPLRVPTNVYGAWFGIVGIALDAPRATRVADATSRSASDALARDDSWQPTVAIARRAAALLEERAGLTAELARGTAAIPGMTDDRYTFTGENWMAPTRRWLREDVSTVESRAFDDADAVYVLEVALSNYEHTGSRLLLGVNVKLVDAASREVLDSTRKWKQFRSADFDELFEDDAAGFRALFETSSNELLERALVDLELL